MSTLINILEKPVIRWGAALLWTALFTVQLVQPEQQALASSVIQPAPPSLMREALFTSLHLVTFAFTAWIWCYAGQLDISQRYRWRTLIVVLVIYGAVAELLQMTIPGRNTQLWDMIANVLGILLGVGLWFALQEFQKNLSEKQFSRTF